MSPGRLFILGWVLMGISLGLDAYYTVRWGQHWTAAPDSLVLLTFGIELVAVLLWGVSIVWLVLQGRRRRRSPLSRG